MDKFYIGIDIGDGETAVAVLTEESVSPLMVNLGYKNNSILSVFACDEHGKVFIGENALLLPGLSGQTARFKSRFLTDPGAGTDISSFARGIAEALNAHSGLMSKEHSRRMIVGCPTGAGWTEEKRAHYASIIRNALPIDPQPVGESRAAFLYTRYSGDVNIPKDLLNKNVLVIDMGSSTTDLAYVVGGREKVGVFGAEFLGGGILDKLLLDACVANNPMREEIMAFFDRAPGIRNRYELTARKLKEGYFTAQAKGETYDTKAFEVVYYGRTRQDYTRLELSVDDDRMLDLLVKPLDALGGRSYMESFEALLKTASEVTVDAPPDLVILTGGASRMPFVAQAVKARFEKAVVASCDKPEFSIAKGLAFACRVDARMSAFRKEISAYTDSDLFVTQLDQAIPHLISTLADSLAPQFVDLLFKPEMKDTWRDASGQATVSVRKLEDVFFSDPTTRDAFTKAIAEWGENHFGPMTEHIRTICTKHKADPAHMPTPEFKKLPLSLPAFELGPVVRLLSRLPLIGGMIRRRYEHNAREAMQSLMSNRSGKFYLELRTALKNNLKADIDRRAKEVEIPIV